MMTLWVAANAVGKKMTMVGYTTGLRVPTNPMYGGEDAR